MLPTESKGCSCPLYVFRATTLEPVMNIDKIVFRILGLVMLLSAILAYYHSPYWLCLTALMGLNMFQASFSGVCPLSVVLKKMGYQPGTIFK